MLLLLRGTPREDVDVPGRKEPTQSTTEQFAHSRLSLLINISLLLSIPTW